VSQNHDDIAARLRDEASAAAPERLRADVMLRVRAEPRPQRIRPTRSFGRSFAAVAVAACILGAMVFGLSRVDLGGGSASGGAGATAAHEKAAQASGNGGGVVAPPGTTAKRGLTYQAEQPHSTAAPKPDHALRLEAVPRPLRAAVLGRYRLATPLRKAFGAIDPHHGPNRR
jgi:negative regulator of sigma E activity